MTNFVHIGKNITMILWIARKLVNANIIIHLMFDALLTSFKNFVQEIIKCNQLPTFDKLLNKLLNKKKLWVQIGQMQIKIKCKLSTLKWSFQQLWKR
jgi:hypothetical protein